MKKAIKVFVAMMCAAFMMTTIVHAQSEMENIATSGSNATAITAPVFNGSDEMTGTGYRGFSVPGEVHFPGMPSYFGQTTPGSSFQSAKTILIYKKTFTIDELKLMAKGGMFDNSKIIVTTMVPKVKDDKDKSKTITVYLRNPSKTIIKDGDKIKAVSNDNVVNMLGLATIKTDDKDVVSAKEMARICLKAIDYGANSIHITAEGVERFLKSFGCGIGFNSTASTIRDSEKVGSASTGGMGISWGSANYVDCPWLQVFILSVNRVQ